MLARVITGGQTGADQAGWRAARAAGLATGGWMPRGFLTEAGPRPEFAARFGAMEAASEDYTERTLANVRASDASLIFAVEPPGPGTTLTIAACRDARKPYLVIHLPAGEGEPRAEEVARWLRDLDVGTLNVAGDRESHATGVGALVESFLSDVLLAYRRMPGGPS